LFEYDNVGSYIRVFDARDADDTEGFFFQDGQLKLHPYAFAPQTPISALQYVQVTLVDDGTYVRGYVDGVKVVDLVDTQGVAAIGTNSLFHFFRQQDGQYAPGGRVARIRLFNGAMTDAEVAALDHTVAVAPIAPSGAVAVADYRFGDSLQSSIASAPDLAFEGGNIASYLPDTVSGTTRTILDFGVGGGLGLDATGMLTRDRYSVVALVEYDSVGSYIRVLDARDANDTEGFFFQDGQLKLHPYPAAAQTPISAGQFVQVVLVDDGLYVRGYVGGTKVVDLIDTQGVAALGTNSLLHFFRQREGNYAPGGRVARLRLFNGAMTDADVPAITPLAPPGILPPSGAALVADYQFQDTFASSVNGAPPIVPSAADQVSFVNAPDLNGRRVLKFNASQGLELATTGLIDPARYTIVMGFSFDSVGSYERIFDPKTPTDTTTWFSVDGRIAYNPLLFTTDAVIAAGDFSELALVNDHGLVRAFADGQKLFEFFDPADLGSIGTNGLVSFFRNSDGLYAPGGRVTRIRIYNGALIDTEVAAIVPSVPGPDLASIPPGANVDLAFNGGYLTVADTNTLTAPYTVEFWGLPAAGGGFLGVLATRSPQDAGFDATFSGGTAGLHADIGDGAGNWLTTAADYAFPQPVTNWVHVAYVVRTNSYEIVVNGQSAVSGDLVGTAVLINADHQLTIGNSVGELMNGQLDEIRIWNIARTSGQIASDYQSVLRGNETGLVHYYRFSEGRGRTTADAAQSAMASPAVFFSAGNTLQWAATGPPLNNLVQSNQPDLAPLVINGPASVAPGQTAAIVYTVANRGSAPAVGPWTDAIYLSRDTNATLASSLGLFLITNTIPPGNAMTFTQQVVIPINGPSGLLYFAVSVDSGNAILESNEGNNVLVAAGGVTIPGTLTLALAASEAREDSGSLSASVTRNGDFTAALAVILASSDASHATASNSIIIPAGQATANFLITLIHDGKVTGPVPMTLTASAGGFQSAVAPFTVLDVDLPALGLSFSPPRFMEGGSTMATVTRQGSTAAALPVNLGGPLGHLNFPPGIVIGAGQSSAVFAINSIDDSTPGPSQTNLFTAASDGYTMGSAALIVDDADVPNLRVTLAVRTVGESAGPQATAATVTRDRPSPLPLIVSLISENPAVVQVPAAVTIPAGATNATFNIAVTDNSVTNGSIQVAIGAVLIDPATGLTLVAGAPDILTVINDHGPSLHLDLAAAVVAEGLHPATSGTVTRNTNLTSALVITLTSGSPALAIVPPTVTIPAGAPSAAFPINSGISGIPNNGPSIPITASAVGYTSATKTLVVTDGSLPDLVVASLTAPGTAITDSSFNIQFRIENRGLGASGTNFTQRILLSTDPLPSADDEVLLETTFGGSIPAGQFIEQTVQVRSPTTPGDYWIIVITDAYNVVAEILENNNTLVSPTTLHVEKAYSATVAADVTVAPPNTPIGLRGTATLTITNAPAAFVIVDISVRVRGTERHIAALTDVNGGYHTVFQPLPGEGGSYAVAADYPGVTNSPAQATFAILGLGVDPIQGGTQVAEGSNATNSTLVHNLADVSLTSLAVSVVSAPPGIMVTPSLSMTKLDGDGMATLTLGLAATIGASSGDAVVHIVSAEGAAADLSFPITVALDRPRLVATPVSITAGMRRGGQSTVQFAVTNAGTRATGPLNVLAPVATWLKVSSGTLIPPLDAGAGAIVSLLLTPAADLDLGPYTGSIVVNSTNAGLNVPFTFRNLSDAIGGLSIETVDEYTYYAAGSPKLTNALVRVVDSASQQLVATNLTGADGAFLLPSLREAYYDIEVTADGHSTFKSTVLVSAGKTNDVTAFLSRQTVRYIFSVVPTSIQDKSEIVVTTTFETYVPIPVLTVDPPYFDLSGWSGAPTQVNVTLMNHGLLAANNVRLTLPQTPDVMFSSLISQIGTLPAQSSLTAPILIQRVNGTNTGAITAARSKAIRKAAGGACYADASFSFDLVCGPQVNTYNVPLRFDKLGGCPQSIFTLTIPVCQPFNFSIGGPGGAGYTPPTCPDCFNNGPPVLFTPPRFVLPPNNCNPCIEGLAGNLVACISITPPAKAGNCALNVGICAVGLSGGINAQSAAGCLANAGACLGGENAIAMQLPACLLPPPACLTGLGLGGKGSAAKQRGARKQSLADLPGLPSAVQPLFRQLDRAVAFIAPVTNLFGSEVWLQGVDGAGWSNWFSVFTASIQLGSPDGERLSTNEISQLLAMPAPSAGATPADVTRFAARWNRSFDYYNRGIFTLAEVPAGESPDFVATDVAIVLAQGLLDANAGAVADGYSDPLTALWQAGQDFLTKASGAGGGICATVKLQIDQEAVVTRDAFNASLEIDNATAQPLTDISVDLIIHSDDGNDTTSLFAVRPPTLDGLTAVDGTGQIAANSTGKASWILIPSSDVAPNGPVTEVVGGTIRYQQDGELITVPLTPSAINVLPNASLSLTYFHQRDVFADDPFTPEIEPSIPYALAVMIQNNGKGTARNVNIASAQPKIIDNQKGLLIDFKIIASEVAGQALTPSLTANFGDIEPGQIKIGTWLLESTLQGLFTDYSASFENLDGLGAKRFSIIQSVEIHEIDHVVQADRGFEDGQPDFLANDVPDLNDYPDTLHLSQGTNMPVIVVTNATPDALASAGHLTVTLTAAMPSGWGYLRVPDPGNGMFKLIDARRTDNSQIALGTNVWTTDRTFIGFSQKPVRENILHLLDFQGAGAYTLIYKPLSAPGTNAPSSSVAALPAQSAPAIPVSWSGTDGAGGGGIAFYDIYVSMNGDAFAPWLQKTTDNGAIYSGTAGTSYAFYSVATDLAGNREMAPAAPEAQTTVSLVNTAPVITAAAAQTVDEGAVVILINSAVDHDIPLNTLAWSLGAGSPPGAFIDTVTGAVSWPTTVGMGPSTNHFTIVVTDNGQPSLSATGLVTVILRKINTAPILSAITNSVINELKTLIFIAQAADYDLPTNTLTFSLGSAPTGAKITANGLFTWTPTRLQGPTTNVIQVIVTDNGVPPLSANQSFTVIVRDTQGAFDLSVESIAALLSPQISVPLTINSGLDLTDLTFLLQASSDRLHNVSILPLIPELSVATVTLRGSSNFLVHFSAGAGELLQGNRAIASLTFQPGTNEHSEIVTVTPQNILGTRSTGETVANGRGVAGRLLLIGLEPLLAAEPGDPVTLKLYGNPGRTYTLEHAADLPAAPPWQFLLQYTQTNVTDMRPIAATNSAQMYRLRGN
jgi:hypothetical protein